MTGLNAETRQRILDKNRRLIDMVIERAKRDFPDDIAIIGLTGSFSTDDYHEKSDLDLIIINNTDRGWGIARAFILDDVGYDIYCTPWDTRILAQSKMESNMVSCLVDLQILYCAAPEYMERFNAYRQAALDELAKPIGQACLDRAQKWIDEAKKCQADAMLSEDRGAVRYATGAVLYHLISALVSMNNTYVKRGAKRYVEMLRALQHLPDGFEGMYFDVIGAGEVKQMRAASLALLKSVVELHSRMCGMFTDEPVPTYDNLWGTYEELWCNCRNKVIASTDAGDVSYAFHAALGAQNYLDEMTKDRGTPKIDLMQHFRADELGLFREKFLEAMDEYLDEYRKVGREVERYDTVDALYEAFMAQ